MTADNFFAENITFENDFNRTHPATAAGLAGAGPPGHRRSRHLPQRAPARQPGHCLCRQPQLRSGCADCTPARQYFSDCYIDGNVDFIFGDGKAVFETARFTALRTTAASSRRKPSIIPSEDSGFVINRCKLTADPGVIGNVFLGRPWRPIATVDLHEYRDGRQN